MSAYIVVLVWVPFEDLNVRYKTISMMFLGIMFENTAYIRWISFQHFSPMKLRPFFSDCNMPKIRSFPQRRESHGLGPSAMRSLRKLRKTGGYALRADSAPACLGTEAAESRGRSSKLGHLNEIWPKWRFIAGINMGLAIAMFDYRIRLGNGTLHNITTYSGFQSVDGDMSIHVFAMPSLFLSLGGYAYLHCRICRVSKDDWNSISTTTVVQPSNI